MTTTIARFPHSTNPKRRGAVTVEAIIALPVLLLISFAAFQFGVMVVVQSTVSHAANIAAREAAKDPAPTAAGLVPVVEEILATHGITIGPDATIVLENPGSTTTSAGLLTCSAAASPPPPTAGEVRVTVCVDLTKAPFLFGFSLFGFDFVGDRLEVSAMTTKEG